MDTKVVYYYKNVLFCFPFTVVHTRTMINTDAMWVELSACAGYSGTLMPPNAAITSNQRGFMSPQPCKFYSGWSKRNPIVEQTEGPFITVNHGFCPDEIALLDCVMSAGFL